MLCFTYKLSEQLLLFNAGGVTKLHVPAEQIWLPGINCQGILDLRISKYISVKCYFRSRAVQQRGRKL